VSAANHRRPDGEVSLRRAQLATGYVFAMSGLMFGCWSARLADVKDRVDASPGALGAAMFLLAAGSITTMALAPRLIARFGIARVAGVGIALTYSFFVIAAQAQSLVALGAMQLCVGLASGSMGVALGAQAVSLQEASGRPIASRFHGCHSAGGVGGALLGAALATVLTPAQLITGVAVAGIAGLVVAWRWLPDAIPAGVREAGGTRLNRRFAAVGALAGAAAFGEGAVVAFGAVHLRDTVGASSSVAGLGFAALAVSMVLVRAVGPVVLTRWRPPVVLRCGGATTVVGALLIAAAPIPAVAVVGCAIVGAGVALVYPAATVAATHSQIGARRGMRVPNDAFSVAVLIGTGAAVLSGPIIGGLAEVAGTRIAFVAVAVAGVVITAYSTRLPQRGPAVVPVLPEPAVLAA
jgi:MFS family permease